MYFHLLEKECILTNKKKVTGLVVGPWSALKKWRYFYGDCCEIAYRLVTKGVDCPITSSKWPNDPESRCHVFFGCPLVQSVWNHSCCWNDIQTIVDNAESLTECVFDALKHVWKATNKLCL